MERAEGDESRGTLETERGSALASVLVAQHSRRGRGRSGGGRRSEERQTGLLGEKELADIESTYADGMTAVQIVEIFVSRGVRFSEATFRKYVQQGLVPRSRRIGRKGKHRGSMGVYPAKAVRRINAIKKLMAEGYTIEEIQERFLRFTDALETLEEGLTDLFEQFEAEVAKPALDTKERKSFQRELGEARKAADELLDRINGLSQRVTRSSGDGYRSTGAAGSAEELL